MFIVLYLFISILTILPGAQGQELLPSSSILNSGWTNNLDSLKVATSQIRNLVVLTLIEPETVMDFRSGEKLRQSYWAKDFFPSAYVGHGIMSWKCEYRGRSVHGTVAQTGEKSQQVREMVLNGWGLTPFISVYPDGFLQTIKIINEELRITQDLGLKSRSVAVEVSKKGCEQMLDFLVSYADHASVPQSRFGYLLNPEKFEGAGCLPFALALLRKAVPLNLEKFNRWVAFRADLLGYGRELPEGPVIPLKFAHTPQPSHKVSFYEIHWGPWELPTIPSIKVNLVDPEMLILFIEELGRSAAELLTTADRSVYQSLNPGYRTVVAHIPDPVPLGRIPIENLIRPYSQYRWTYVIDSSFDAVAADISKYAKAFYQELRSQGFSASYVRRAEQNSQPGIIILRSSLSSSSNLGSRKLLN